MVISKNIKNLFIAVFALVLGATIYFSIAKSEMPILRILAYDEFVNSMGPGPELVRIFESSCRCRVEMVRVTEAALLLPQLKETQASRHFAMVIGLDQLMLEQAKKVSKWQRLQLGAVEWSSAVDNWVNNEFAPIDWAPLTFIYREGTIDPPKSPNDLLDARFKKMISISDPRTSSSGLQLLRGLFFWWGDKTFDQNLTNFKENLLAVTANWSLAYSLFQREQAQMVFSYQTSLIYHWLIQKDHGFKSVEFSEGHPQQVEFFAIPEDCENCELGHQFAKFLLEVNSQKIIMSKNYMFPAVKTAQVGSLFEQLPDLKLIPKGKGVFEEQQDKILKRWSRVFP